ncbi:MAG: hypothetical protein ACR2OU_19535 [Thermomicrobiales bacterium]
MNKLRPIGMLRVCLAVIFMLASLLPILSQNAAASTAAQDDGLIDDSTYVSMNSGETITWSGSWAYDEESSTPEVDGEVIALSSDTGGVLFSYFPVGIDKNSARDQILSSFADGADDFVQVDRGSYDNVSYSLDRASLSGAELGIFTLFIERTSNVFVSLFLAPVSLFQQGLASAQSDIQVEGTGVFAGIQPSGLQDALNASGGSSTTTQPKATTETVEKTPKPKKTATEEATEEDTPAEEVATEEDTPTEEVATDVTPKSKKTTTKDRPTPTEKKTTKTTSGSTDYSDLGVVADGEYESPQFGSSVSWDKTWVIDDAADEPVLSDTKDETDQIVFSRADQSGPETFGSVSVRMFPASSNDTPESIVEYWTSDFYLNGGAGDGSAVLLSDSTSQESGVVLLSTLDSGTEVIQYLSVFFLDRGKTAVVVEFYATPDSVEGALLDAQDGITVEGDPILTLFDPSDILDAYNQ